MEDVNRDAQRQPVVVKPLLMQQQNKAMCEESIGKSDDASMLTVSYLTILFTEALYATRCMHPSIDDMGACRQMTSNRCCSVS